MDIIIQLRNAVIGNDIEEVKAILNSTKIPTHIIQNKILLFAVKFSDLNIIKLLLEKKEVNPSVNENTCAYLAHKRQNDSVLKLLYADIRVRQSISIDHPSIAQELVTKTINKKLSNF
jgi:hypothetical protein